MGADKYQDYYQVVEKKSVELNEKEQKERNAWEYYTRTKEVAPAPLHVDVEVTNACNISCIMCERRNMKRKVGFMSMELYKEIIRQCIEYGIPSIKLNLWGESLLHKEIIEMIRYAKENGIVRTQFNTNGIYMTEKMSKDIFESGLDLITFSVDGATKETYEKIRKNSTYDTVMRNLETMFEIKEKYGYTKPHITLQIIQMKDTENEIELFVNKWKDIADYISVTNIGTTSGMECNLDRSVRDYNTLVKTTCPQLWQRLSIAWNGDVTVCCSDFDFYHNLGNVKDRTLVDLWNTDKLTELRRNHKNKIFTGICSTCTDNFMVKEE